MCLRCTFPHCPLVSPTCCLVHSPYFAHEYGLMERYFRILIQVDNNIYTFDKYGDCRISSKALFKIYDPPSSAFLENAVGKKFFCYNRQIPHLRSFYSQNLGLTCQRLIILIIWTITSFYIKESVWGLIHLKQIKTRLTVVREKFLVNCFLSKHRRMWSSTRNTLYMLYESCHICQMCRHHYHLDTLKLELLPCC